MQIEKGSTHRLSFEVKPLFIFLLNKNKKEFLTKQDISESGKSFYSIIIETSSSNWHYPELIYTHGTLPPQRYDKQALSEVANG
jgi:hypothetical protein